MQDLCSVDAAGCENALEILLKENKCLLDIKVECQANAGSFIYK